MIVDSNYIVMIVVLIIWTGIFFYLVSLDGKVKKMKKDNKRSES
jgi:CcmD family protein